MEQPNLTTQLAALAHALEPSHPQAPALVRWAILHIEGQDEALAEARQEWASEEPYLKAGVYSHVDIKPFIKTLPSA